MADTIMNTKYSQTDSSQTERIVDYLIIFLRIPEGNQLVSFFGTGTEPTNREAMMTWVRGLSHEFVPDEAEYRLTRLVLHTQMAALNDMEDA